MRAILYRGLQIHVGTRTEARATLEGFLKSSSSHQVITLNPEYVVLSARNPALSKLTQAASLCLVDGFGLALVLRRFGPFERYPGADIVPDICTYCTEHQLPVGVILLPGGLSTPANVREAFAKHFPGQYVDAWYADDSVQQKILSAKPALLLVALGQPQQDFWIAEHIVDFPTVRVAIGVGGAVDFLTGVRRRAPRTMRVLGVEWLWRLITQPRRIIRIFRATFGFWYTILFR